MPTSKPRTAAPAQWVENRQAGSAWRDWRRFGPRSRDAVIPAKAGIQVLPTLLPFEASALSCRVDSRLRGNDRAPKTDFLQVASPLRQSFPIRHSARKARAGCPCHVAWPSWPCCECRDSCGLMSAEKTAVRSKVGPGQVQGRLRRVRRTCPGEGERSRERSQTKPIGLS
jgi:hypothetical protein